MPFLKRSPRLAHGWGQRILKDRVPGPFDIWIQSASGGESMLSNMVREELARSVPPGTRLRILATSTTPQGVETLTKSLDDSQTSNQADRNIETTVRYFPFDSPKVMEKAFASYSPRLIVLLETELWPSLLQKAKSKHIPVLLLNGRMSRKSIRSYRRLKWLFGPVAPDRTLAISEDDKNRFGEVFGSSEIGLMDNIKFDRITPQELPDADHPLSRLLPQEAPFVLFGSIRKQEETKIVSTISALLHQRPNLVVGLFPKHLERTSNILSALKEAKLTVTVRSSSSQIHPGSVVVWDTFGELASAYGLARAAFIGGSLVDLGGQNFLEPLVFGIKPVIGPYWSNFSWVSHEIVDIGLVQEVADEHELTATLLHQLDNRQPRGQVIKEVESFLAPRKGGSKQGAEEILQMLGPVVN